MSDTPEMKQIKEEMRNLALEDPDEAFEIISSTSSETVGQIETRGIFSKYFGKLKTKLKRTVMWINKNKDKSLDDILVERWRDSCSEENMRSSLAKCKRKATKKRKRAKQTLTSKCEQSASLKEHCGWKNLFNQKNNIYVLS